MQAHGASLMRRLSSAVHPPLPMTPRQTSQLLASLTSSFQRHLDQAHRAPRSNNLSAPSSARASYQRDSGRDSADSASISETINHFDSIITHPAFAGLQHSPAQDASDAEQVAFRVLKAAEGKLKYGTFNVFEAADLFRALYTPAISLPAPKFSFASRFVSLVKLCGTNSVQQFFSITGVAVKWTRLMVHEQRHHEIVPIMQSSNTVYQLMPHYLTSILRTSGFTILSQEMQRLDGLAKSGYLHLSDNCCRKSILWVSLNMVARQQRQPPEQHRTMELRQSIHALRKTIFGTAAETQTNLMLAITNLVLHADAAPLLAYVKHMQSNEQECGYWTETPSRRRLLLEATLEASSVLCQADAEQQQSSYADAQYLLQFAEIVFSEELQLTRSQKQNKTADIGQEVGSAVSVAPQRSSEDAAILSRVDGLLLG